MCVDFLWVYIGPEFAVLAVSLSLGRQKTDVVQFNTVESQYSQTAVCGVSAFCHYPF